MPVSRYRFVSIVKDLDKLFESQFQARKSFGTFQKRPLWLQISYNSFWLFGLFWFSVKPLFWRCTGNNWPVLFFFNLHNQSKSLCFTHVPKVQKICWSLPILSQTIRWVLLDDVSETGRNSLNDRNEYHHRYVIHTPFLPRKCLSIPLHLYNMHLLSWNIYTAKCIDQ